MTKFLIFFRKTLSLSVYYLFSLVIVFSIVEEEEEKIKNILFCQATNSLEEHIIYEFLDGLTSRIPEFTKLFQVHFISVEVACIHFSHFFWFSFSVENENIFDFIYLTSYDFFTIYMDYSAL